MKESNVKDHQNAVISIRLTADEQQRYVEIVAKAMKKYPYLSKTAINRELFGLAPATVLTEKDIRYFISGKK